MTCINPSQYVYPYGVFSDTSRSRQSPKGEDREGHDILVYDDTTRKSRGIDSLEGYFVSSKPLNQKGSEGVNRPCRRDQMEDFEKMFGGKFVPFEERQDVPTRI